MGKSISTVTYPLCHLANRLSLGVRYFVMAKERIESFRKASELRRWLGRKVYQQALKRRHSRRDSRPERYFVRFFSNTNLFINKFV